MSVYEDVNSGFTGYTAGYNNTNRHFDCLKNKLPYNWTNNNATGYYNRAFWKRCKCKYGPENPCKATADKWCPTATEPTAWTEGCSHCDPYYSRDPSYFYTYNPADCGTCGGNNRANCETCRGNDKPCCCKNDGKCDGKCNDCLRNGNHLDHVGRDNRYDGVGGLGGFGRPAVRDPLQAYVSRSCCNDCQDVAIVYRMPYGTEDCDNIVELKIPIGGTKEFYLAKFSPEFVAANRFQCATVPTYNSLPNNLVDNMRAEEFTISDQASLTKRGINNHLYAQRLIDEGKLINTKYTFSIPMNVYGRTAYYYFGNPDDAGGTQTGLSYYDAFKGYFGPVGRYPIP